MSRGDGQVSDLGHCRVKRLVQPGARTQDVGRRYAEVIGRSRQEAGEARAHGLRGRASEGFGDQGDRAIAGVGAILERHRRSLPVRIDRAIQRCRGGAHAVGRDGDGRRGRSRKDRGRVARRVVGRTHIAAAGDGRNIGDARWRTGENVHRDGNGRIIGAGGQRVGAYAGKIGEIRGPTGTADAGGNQPGGQRVRHVDDAGGGSGAEVGNGNRVAVAGVALREVARMED